MKTIIALAIVLLLYGAVGTLDYATEQAMAGAMRTGTLASAGGGQ